MESSRASAVACGQAKAPLRISSPPLFCIPLVGKAHFAPLVFTLPVGASAVACGQAKAPLRISSPPLFCIPLVGKAHFAPLVFTLPVGASAVACGQAKAPLRISSPPLFCIPLVGKAHLAPLVFTLPVGAVTPQQRGLISEKKIFAAALIVIISAIPTLVSATIIGLFPAYFLAPQQRSFFGFCLFSCTIAMLSAFSCRFFLCHVGPSERSNRTCVDRLGRGL